MVKRGELCSSKCSHDRGTRSRSAHPVVLAGGRVGGVQRGRADEPQERVLAGGEQRGALRARQRGHRMDGPAVRAHAAEARARACPASTATLSVCDV